MERDQLTALLTLLRVPGMGPARIRTAVSAYKTPLGVLDAPFNDLCRLEGIDLKLARSIKDGPPSSSVSEEIDRTRDLGATILTLWDKGYPPLLKKIYDAPILLYVRGAVASLENDSVAVVGTRKPTPYGTKIATELAQGLASSGLTVVSGLASGIDTHAHKGALSVKGGTVAVLGSGIDIIYPSANRKMTGQIEESGAIISEFPLGAKPHAPNFPKRNRIISGLSHATVVVEAGNRSGAILTALDAVDQDRDVFAVPGRLTDPKSLGCLRLIRNGAIPYHSVQHLLDLLNPRLGRPLKPIQKEMDLHLTKEESALFKKISGDPKHVDDIVAEVDSDPSTVLTLLLDLELKGAVVQLSGKQYVRA